MDFRKEKRRYFERVKKRKKLRDGFTFTTTETTISYATYLSESKRVDPPEIKGVNYMSSVSTVKS